MFILGSFPSSVLGSLEIVLPVSQSLGDCQGGPHLPKVLGMLFFVQALSTSVQNNNLKKQNIFYSLNLLMHSLSICTSCPSMDRLLNDPYNSYTEAAIRVKRVTRIDFHANFSDIAKVNMQKRRLNSSVNNKSSLHPYLEVQTLLLSLLLLHVTNTNPLNFS